MALEKGFTQRARGRKVKWVKMTEGGGKGSSVMLMRSTRWLLHLGGIQLFFVAFCNVYIRCTAML